MPSTRISHLRSAPGLFGLLLGFIVLTFALVGTALLARSQQSAAGWVDHTLDVGNRLMTVLSRLQDIETGRRGYLLTGLADYLEPYDTAAANLEHNLSGLEAAIADNPSQRVLAARLRTAATEWHDLTREAIDRYRNGDTNFALNLEQSGRGMAQMNELRRIVASMQANEQTLLEMRRAAAARQADFLMSGLIASGLAVVVLGFVVLRDGRRRLAEVLATRDALAASNDRLMNEATSREAAETQVRQMQKLEAIGQLTGGIAHDFNNMLAIIMGSLELAQRRLDGDRAKAAVCIENAMEGARRAAQLTSRLLAFSRQQALAPQVVDVNKLVGSMSELLRRTIGEQILLETVLAGGLWRTYTDPDQLENAIVNLCVNARDAMPDGGKLTIETANSHLDEAYASAHAEVEPGQYVLISVIDAGVGMPPQVVERAFDPFYTTKGVGKGTGLGLSQVHGFIKQSGGHVKIYSEPGIGTALKLYLPRYSGEGKTAEIASAKPADVPRAKDNEVILVVEDDERVRLISVDSLRELGYIVVQAQNANEALTVLRLQPRVDLLFTDIVMPDMNGRRLAEKMLEIRPFLKVLYTTGYSRNAVVHHGVLDAGVAFLPKPFTIEQLATKIRQVLATNAANASN